MIIAYEYSRTIVIILLYRRFPEQMHANIGSILCLVSGEYIYNFMVKFNIFLRIFWLIINVFFVKLSNKYKKL